jgi:bifunctional DNA-binding transcriptional regulator/antitoxin component of YhaV-PrlF toxin-antitoxin module
MPCIPERGQVTLLKALREQAGLAPGDPVTITLWDDDLVIRRAASIFDYRVPKALARTHSDAAEECVWADAAAADPANRRPDAG